MLCHYAIADITGANPNVFYELGIRHALRPRSTVILFVEGTVIPFDIALVRGISYRTDGKGEPVDIDRPIAAIANQLSVARADPHDDSPIFQLIDDLPRQDIDHTKTDVFRKSVDYSKKYKDRLAAAVRQGVTAVEQIAAEPGLGNLLEVESGVMLALVVCAAHTWPEVGSSAKAPARARQYDHPDAIVAATERSTELGRAAGD